MFIELAHIITVMLSYNALQLCTLYTLGYSCVQRSFTSYPRRS